MLVLTPAPFATESLLGYVLRLAENNGYKGPAEILMAAGYDEKERRTAGFSLEKLAATVGRDPAELEGISYYGQADGAPIRCKILSHELHKYLKASPLQLKKPAFCPVCVKEAAYIEAFWDLALAVACPRHRCKVLEACPACGKPLTWFRPGLLRCGCGADLSVAALDPADPGVSDLMAVIEAKLHGKPLSGLRSCSGLPLAHLEPLSLLSLLTMLEGLAKQKYMSLGQVENKEPYRTVQAASEVLSHWPSGLHALLKDLGETVVGNNPSAASVKKQFLKFCGPMFNVKVYGDGVKFLRDEFLKFSLESWNKGIVDPRMLAGRGKEGDPRFVSASALARAANVDSRTIKSWTEKGLISVRQEVVGKAVRYIVDQKEVGIAAQAPGKTYHVREAAARLEIPVSVLGHLKESGHFAVTHMPKHKKSFHEADLSIFHKRLLGKSVAISDRAIDESSAVSLREILHYARFGSTTHKAKFVEAYLDGAVRSMGRRGTTLGDVLFSNAEIDRYVRESRALALGDTLTQLESARLIGCDVRAIRGLLEKGYLDGKTTDDVTRVQRQSIESFSRRFVPLAILAKKYETSSKRLRKLCVRCKIPALEFSGQKGSAIGFIHIDDEEALVMGLEANLTRKQTAERRADENPGIVTRVSRYLENLRTNGESLPRLGNRLNKGAIAKACGVNRNIFSQRGEAAALIEAFEAEEVAVRGIAKRDDLEILKQYLGELKERNLPIPRGENGQPNKVAIARACGIHRNRLYRNPEIKKLLEEADRSA